MISKTYQAYCKEKFNSTSHYIFLKDKDRLAHFKNVLPHFMETSNNFFIGPNNTLWKLMIPTAENMDGRRVIEAIVDSSMDEEFFKEVIIPSCQYQCIRIEFFD